MNISDDPSPNADVDDVTTQKDDANPICSDLTPSMIVLLKDNAAFLATEYKKLERETNQSHGDLSSENTTKVSLEVLRLKNQERSKSIINKFQDMNLEDQKDESLLSLVNEIKDLEIQVQERKKWAEEKAVQVAKRLCDERNELKKLKMLKDNEQMRKQEKSTLDIDHPTMKSLSDVEMTSRKVSEKVDEAVMVIARLESENMEMKAEIEALKLSACESITKRLEASRREKKHNKTILASEKQKAKLHQDIASEKQKLMDLEQEILQVEAARKATEAKWRVEHESKKNTIERVKQERRLKKQSELNNKRKQKSLQQKIDLDLKRDKDDMQRLEEELARVKSWVDPDLSGSGFEYETIGKLVHEDDDNDDDGHECVMCEENETCVVFLPCGHEIVCVDCSEKLKKDECPICGIGIEERIRFGSEPDPDPIRCPTRAISGKAKAISGDASLQYSGDCSSSRTTVLSRVPLLCPSSAIFDERKALLRLEEVSSSVCLQSHRDHCYLEVVFITIFVPLFYVSIELVFSRYVTLYKIQPKVKNSFLDNLFSLSLIRRLNLLIRDCRLRPGSGATPKIGDTYWFWVIRHNVNQETKFRTAMFIFMSNTSNTNTKQIKLEVDQF
ncbi:hypothetical protein LXL04_029663 [Taraxacum kok-saghyz]